MNTVDIHSTLTPADWQAYRTHWAERAVGNGRRVTLALCVVVGVAIGMWASSRGHSFSWVSFVAGVVLCFIGPLYSSIVLRKRAMPDSDSLAMGPGLLTLSATGIDVVKEDTRGHYEWRRVRDVSRTTEHLFIWLDRTAALIVPLRDLPPGTSVETLSQWIQSCRDARPMAVRDEPRADGAATAATTSEAPQAARSTMRSLRAFVRILTLRTAPAADLSVSSKVAWLFPAVAFLSWLFADWSWAGDGAEFYAYGLLVWSWYALAALAMAWCCSRLSQPPLPYARVIGPLLVLTPVFVLLHLARLQWLDETWDFAASVWILILIELWVARVLQSMTQRLQPRAALACIALLGCGLWFVHSTDVNANFWYPSLDEGHDEEFAAYQERRRQSEALLFTQAQRIDAAVDALRRPGDISAAAFFVGFAGVGEQKVFAEEIALAQKVVADAFGSEERSLRLVNDRRDLDSLPLASPTALAYALKRVAARMNLQQDVLFLSLSSHGSEDGELSVSNGPIALNALTANDVAAALRQAGIRWKVVIVSACYAGAFIEPLRDDHTIVIAAAAANRTSFGCADDRDLTYFGEAFYRDAFPGADSLQTAFEHAVEAIGRREKEEGIRGSLPQAHFGAALEAHLRESFGRG